MIAQTLLLGSMAMLALGQGVSASSSSSSSSNLPGGGSDSTASSGSSQTTSSSVAAQTTASLFIGGVVAGEHFAASVVGVGCGHTTYVIACTAGEYVGANGQETNCNPAHNASATYSGDFFEISSATDISGTKVTLVESCSLTGSTEAACTTSYGATAGNTKTKTSYSTTYTGDVASNKFFQVPLTAGVAALSTTTSCTDSGAMPTGVIDVYKVLVAPAAAAAILGGALA
ncbi:hypothetical protein GGR56DRAFT_156149 [Xylariaceae sp. FL0804]|nr:hypothetical protein GGR56DRAFT_156149 [Xylariaceae sp. FL0804]